jgi:hypothetical protein
LRSSGYRGFARTIALLRTTPAGTPAASIDTLRAKRRPDMAKRTVWETVRAQGEQVVDEVKRLIHEGNVRRVVVKQKDRVVAEFPLTVGVVGAVAAPVLAAIGALVAVLADCRIDVEREGRPRAVRRAPTRRASARPRAKRRAKKIRAS